MKPVVLVGHAHDCPLHGRSTVKTGAKRYTFNGKAVARVGDEMTTLLTMAICQQSRAADETL